VGVDIVRRNYASPIPDVDRLPRSLWAAPHPLPGVAFDLERQFRLLEEELAPFVAEFGAAIAAGRIEGFDLGNPMYGAGDADALYAMVRRLRPRTVIEVGSGHSTLVTAAALARNAEDGPPGRLVALDPAPRRALPAGFSSRVEHRPVAIEDAPASVFESLDAGDVLFVDSSHVVRIGGDVNRIVLELLPRLGAGVHVHFHDVFLPWEYPRRLAEREEKFWTEQYLLHAFLIGNDGYEVVLGLYALTRHDRARAATAIPALATGAAPGAFWIRRTGAG
jgi:hypothetical protein